MEPRKSKGPGVMYVGTTKDGSPKIKLLLNSEILREAISAGGTVELVGFRNDYKSKETDPDFNLRFAKKREGNQGASASGNNKAAFPF